MEVNRFEQFETFWLGSDQNKLNGSKPVLNARFNFTEPNRSEFNRTRLAVLVAVFNNETNCLSSLHTRFLLHMTSQLSSTAVFLCFCHIFFRWSMGQFDNLRPPFVNQLTYEMHSREGISNDVYIRLLYPFSIEWKIFLNYAYRFVTMKFTRQRSLLWWWWIAIFLSFLIRLPTKTFCNVKVSFPENCSRKRFNII